ncbi:MAG TPA: MBL fold metallo-hydrolase [Candidatus Dormibacteraeota bacterium]|nr:MBL fold metallo-hydrolase [Candidatus Dormibacteraeota bacterium]
MHRELFLRQASRRDILHAGFFLAGGSALAGLMPRTFLHAAQGAAAPADAVEQMKAQMSAVPLQTLQLRDNIHMMFGPGGNMVVLDGPDGKILVDASFARVAPKIKQMMDGFSSAPLKLLIDTHWHFDHTDGNAAMHEMGAMILAHENTRKRLSTPQEIGFFGMHFPPSPPEALPVQTFPDTFRLYLNKEEMRLAHVAPAHTDSDIQVHYVTSNVLHMGDTYFAGMYPFLDASTGGRINGMIAAANRGITLADASTKIVPGHGPLGDKASLTKYRDMLVTVRDRVRKQKSSGKTLQEAIAAKPTASFDAAFGNGLLKPDQFVTLVYTTL